MGTTAGDYVFFGVVGIGIGLLLILFRGRAIEGWADWVLFPFRARPTEGWISLARFSLWLLSLISVIGGSALLITGIVQLAR